MFNTISNLCTQCWGECKCAEAAMETLRWFLKQLKIELPYNPTLPLLTIDAKELKTAT
jgi:hypothetical protein